jgi:3-methylfumaryl-CoA hydratase
MGQDPQPCAVAKQRFENLGSQVSLIGAEDLAHLQSWQGHTQTLHDCITAAPLQGMHALLEDADAPSAPDAALPPLWHWLYFLPHTPQSQLGPDGHPRKGNFLPPVPLPRRMWAGGRVHWHAPLRSGQAVQRVSAIQKVDHKVGRSGELVFVQVEHRISHAEGLALTEIHDIVYRPLQQAHTSAAAPPDMPPPVWSLEVVPDDVMLFRYSALTFNSHRIHYDRKYATETEGYPGLVVHGPLLVTWLMHLLRRHCPLAVASLTYKALKPVYECADQRRLRLCGAPSADGHSAQLWVQDHQGDTAMHATVVFQQA